jgi:UDP-N-acetylmuramoyl-tripeptide--D-alanyl-D-alanine ligase
MKILITIIWFLIFAKLFFFWLWLWQLKEFHWGRFLAHFETQAVRKFLFSFKGIRFPRKTNKIIAISLTGIILEALTLLSLLSLPDTWFYSSLLILLLLAPIFSSIIILAFQIPTGLIIKKIMSDAGKKRETFKDLLVIGITGSYGKTSVKEFLGKILSQKFNVLKTQKHINAEIGIAKTILEELKPEHQILIAEIGAYERGKIKEVCRMLKPKIGILTGIGNQHLSTFGSQDNIKKAKYELIESLPKDGIAIAYDKLELVAKNIKVEKEFVSFSVCSPDGDCADFNVNLLGRQNVINILLATSCAKKLGMSLQEISLACQRIKSEQGGMKFLRKESPIALDASYSANFEGVMADLEYIKLYSGKKIIVMPCLIELNGMAKEVHKKIGEKIAEVCDLAIITTADYFKEIKQDSEKIILIENPIEIIKKLKKFFDKDDVILLEGRLPGAIINFFKKNRR